MEISRDNLLDEVSALKEDGFRLVTVTCEREGDGYELIYHFDRDYSMKNLKLLIGVNENVMSISHIYPPAFLIENEYQDLFGLTFDNLIIDYKGSLYLAPGAPKSPFAIKDEKEV